MMRKAASSSKTFSSFKTICIIRANHSREISQMAQGIVSVLMECIERPHVIPVVGNNNVVELTALLYDVIRQYPGIDMIFSIGESSTRIAQKVTQELGGSIPVFFISVLEKLALDIMKNGSNVTGVTCADRDYADQFKSFFHLTRLDSIKKVLVPRSRFAHNLGSAHTNEGGSGLLPFLASHKIETEFLDITCRRDLHTKIKPLLSNGALLALPRDSVLETYADELIAMANERRIPLFSSSFESVEQGAAVSFGSYDTANFGKKDARLSKSILVDGIHPAKVPAVRTNNWVGVIAINREAAIQQGLKLDIPRACADENVMLL